MTDTNDNAQDVPAATDPVLTETSTSKMAEDSVAYFRAEMEKNKEQAIARKLENKRLQAELDDLKKQVETLTTERDKAVNDLDEYKSLVNEHELAQENQNLRNEIKVRDLHDAFKEVEGVEYQDGVSLDDIMQASKIDPSKIVEIRGQEVLIQNDPKGKPESHQLSEFVTKAIEAARTSKPFLFSSGSASEQSGDVRQEAAPAQTLKAFGAQAVGGGSAPPAAKGDPAKTVDWRDPAAINRYVANQKG